MVLGNQTCTRSDATAMMMMMMMKVTATIAHYRHQIIASFAKFKRDRQSIQRLSDQLIDYMYFVCSFYIPTAAAMFLLTVML